MKKIAFWISGLFALIPGVVFAAPSSPFNSMFCPGRVCANYNQWMKGVWTWSIGVMVPLATLMLAAAGFLWMTSAGDTKKIDLSKKIIYGVVSGIALIILARLILNSVIGVPTNTVIIN